MNGNKKNKMYKITSGSVVEYWIAEDFRELLTMFLDAHLWDEVGSVKIERLSGYSLFSVDGKRVNEAISEHEKGFVGGNKHV